MKINSKKKKNAKRNLEPSHTASQVGNSARWPSSPTLTPLKIENTLKN